MMYKLLERKIDELYEETKKFCDAINNSIMTPNELRQQIGLEPIKETTTVSITNCKNCGAPLSGENHCEYCGTYY